MKNTTLIFLILLFSNSTIAQPTETKTEQPEQPETIHIATEEDVKKDVEKVVCKNKERLESVKQLFVDNGFDKSQLKVIDYGHTKNLELVLPGKSEESVVVGAHYDLVNSCGVIDNWTGVVILAKLARTINSTTTDKTFRFVAFGSEEKGLIGSTAYVNEIPKEDTDKYCSMVNFDSFGFDYPQVMRNASSSKLIKLAKETSKAMKFPFGAATIPNATTDSASFKVKKIPALALHGLNGRWQEYLHTRRDNIKNVNFQSVYLAYRYGIPLLAAIDGKPCDAYR